MRTTLHQLELDQTAVNCGASYVIQLEGGSFIIIDGGYFTDGEEDRLYSFLREHAVGTPIIDGWFFSHAHQDHIGNFILFIRKYGTSVDLRRLLYSFHPIDVSDADDDWKRKSNDLSTIKEFYRTIEERCADVEKVTLRTGDEIVFEELRLKVIYTYEDLYPIPASFNEYSTVILTTVGEHSVLWLGDASAKAAAVMLERPDSLKCDMVQIAHHGIDNNEKLCALYAATEAKVALWPTPDYGMESRRDQLVNHFILHEMSIEEHFVSGYGTVELPLPYTPGMATKHQKSLSIERSGSMSAWEIDSHLPTAFRYLTPECIDPDKRTKQSEQGTERTCPVMCRHF